MIQALTEASEEEEQGTEWVRPVFWTDAMEAARVADERRKQEALRAAAVEGVEKAKRRVRADKKNLEFQLMPAEQQLRIRRREEARKAYFANKEERKRLIRKATFHDWDVPEQRIWLFRALMDGFDAAWQLKKSKLKDRTNSVKLDVFQEQQVTEAMGMLDKDSMSKIMNRFGLDNHTAKAEAAGTKPSFFEMEQDMIACFRAVSKGLARTMTTEFDCRLLDDVITNAQEEAAAKMAKSSLSNMLSPAVFQIRKIATEAEIMVRKGVNCFHEMLAAVKEFAYDVLITSKKWRLLMARFVAAAVLRKFDAERWVREKGRDEATNRIISAFRQLRVKRILKKLWERTQHDVLRDMRLVSQILY